MKVFEVTTEYCIGDEKEITREHTYVTAEDDSIQTVWRNYTEHCEQYEKELIGAREVLTIVHHIKK